MKLLLDTHIFLWLINKNRVKAEGRGQEAEGLRVNDKLPQEWEMVCLRFEIGDNYNNLKQNKLISN